jgi:hypothetical protein
MVWVVILVAVVAAIAALLWLVLTRRRPDS